MDLASDQDLPCLPLNQQFLAKSIGSPILKLQDKYLLLIFSQSDY